MKPTFKYLTIGTALSLGLVAIGASYAQNAAVVNGKPINSAMVDFVLKKQAEAQMQTQGQVTPVTPEQRKKLIDNMIDMEVLAQDAIKKGLGGKDLEIELELIKKQMLVRAEIQYLKDKTVISDAEIQAEYDQNIKNVSKEYRARHILLEDEATAKSIIAKLKAGEKFEDLAKQSKDSGSAEKGGDLDFAAPAGYVKPFADALLNLNKGELTQTPVKSEFGYHVIEVTDIRDATPPSLTDVKEEIKNSLLGKKIQAYQEGLRKAAIVK